MENNINSLICNAIQSKQIIHFNMMMGFV